MTSNSIKHLVTTAVLLCLAGAASAQYVWLDEKGSKQFSDMPPPANVPKSRILKSPGFTARSAPATDEAASGSSEGTDTKTKGPMTLKEREMDYKKRQTEQAEKDKKAAEKKQAEADKATNCERARSYNQALSSGQRMPRVDANGERSYMSDEERAKELRESQKQLADCK